MLRRLSRLAVALAVAAIILGADASRSGSAVVPVSHPVALGVCTRGVAPPAAHPGRALSAYAAKVGRMPKVVMWYQTWHGGPLIVRRLMDAVHNHGAVPMITWMPLVSRGTAARLAGIAAGNYDGYLRTSAADARAWGHRFLLRPFHEMNGRWAKWGIPAAGTAQEFVAAWRHIVSVFRSVGASNVRFVFSPNVISRNSPTFTGMYPGDRYVDRVALDGYNWGTSTSGQTWRSFHDIFADSYHVLAGLSARPMLIGETASTERGGNKAGWITHAFRRDMSQFPRIRAVVWFNHRKETNWQVDSSATALQAYRQIVRAE